MHRYANTSVFPIPPTDLILTWLPRHRRSPAVPLDNCRQSRSHQERKTRRQRRLTRQQAREGREGEEGTQNPHYISSISHTEALYTQTYIHAPPINYRAIRAIVTSPSWSFDLVALTPSARLAKGLLVPDLACALNTAQSHRTSGLSESQIGDTTNNAGTFNRRNTTTGQRSLCTVRVLLAVVHPCIKA